MQVSKKTTLITFVILLLLTVTTVGQTYAKYISTANGTANVSIAKWRILVNDEDIRDNTVISQVITPTFDASPHIANNVIAPNSTGYFILIIDSSNVDVSFTYTLNFIKNSNSLVDDFIVTGYELNDGPLVALTREEQFISNTILNTTNPNTTTLKIYVEWVDSENQTMNNVADTNTTLTNSASAGLDVSLSFIQYIET